MTGGPVDPLWRVVQPGWKRFTQFLGEPDERWDILLPLALVVGLASGLSAVGLRTAVHVGFEALAPFRTGPLAPLLPALGAAVGVALVTHLFREPEDHGVPDVIRAVCRGGGRMRRRSIVSRWLGSLATVSSGGSAGLEGPIVHSAAAVGSAIGGMTRSDERRRTVLLACGVAGGISAVFNAPMTGMIFAMEVVLAEWSVFSIVPVVLSAVAATELSRLVLAQDQTFSHPAFDMGTTDLGLCLLLGVAAGFASAALVRTIRGAHRAGRKLGRWPLAIPVVFGLLVGLLGMAAPPAIGEGYDTVQAALDGKLETGLLLCAGLLAAKVLTTSLTLGSGAPGGVFAPCLVVGSVLGTAFARLAKLVVPESVDVSSEGSYALVGMAGLVAGVMHAPLTGIFLVMEVTGGYAVILPLMIVAVLSLLVARHFDRYSIYASELAESGDLLRAGTDRRILADLGVQETLDADATPVHEDITLEQFVEVVKLSNRNHFPVLRAGSEDLAGMLHLSAVREVLYDQDVRRVTLVGTVMDADVARVPVDTNVLEALAIFEDTGAWVLPVVDGERFVGLISKSTLFDHYRRELSVQEQR